MFSAFKKQIHDPLEMQHADLRNEAIGPLAMAGVDCDELPGSSGPFGLSYNNPIPVNGMMGTYKYLNKLRSSSGVGFYFHRLGSIKSQVTPSPVDAYEVVDINGQNWDILFIDMYHPRRSNKVPPGFTYAKYIQKLGDLPFAFGIDIFCSDFPHDLPEAIERHNNLPAFAKKVRELLIQSSFERPKNHEQKLQIVRMKLISMRT